VSAIEKQPQDIILLAEDDSNTLFRRITTVFFVIAILLALLVAMTDLPALTRAEKEKIPPQLVKILARKTVAETPKPEPKPELIKVDVPELEAEIELEDEPKVTASESATQVQISQAREKAMGSGLLALTDELNAMRESFASDELQQLGDLAQPVLAKEEQQNTFANERAALSELALATSGGIADLAIAADLPAEVKLAANPKFSGIANAASLGLVPIVADVKFGAVELQSAPNSHVVPDVERPVGSKPALPAEPIADNTLARAVGARTTESIRQTFDKNKGALYSIYRRALRQDPALQGKVTINLVIEASGVVSMVKLIVSELEFEPLESKLLARIKMINFGPAEGGASKINYSFNFLPF